MSANRNNTSRAVKIAKLYLGGGGAGKSVEEISAELGISVATVYRELRDAGVKRQRVEGDEDLLAKKKVFKLVMEADPDFSMTTMSRALGLSRQTMLNWRNETE